MAFGRHTLKLIEFLIRLCLQRVEERNKRTETHRKSRDMDEQEKSKIKQKLENCGCKCQKTSDARNQPRTRISDYLEPISQQKN